MNKFLMAVASLSVVAAPLAASAQSYGHQQGGQGGWNNRGPQHVSQTYGNYRGNFGRGYGHDDRRDFRGADNTGAVVAAGLIGLFLGTALSSQPSTDYTPPYGYAQPYGYGYAAPAAYQSGW